MADTSLLGKIQSPGKKVPLPKSPFAKGVFIDFLSKKIILRIHYPSGEVKEHDVKVTMHYFEIEDMVYVIHSDAIYRQGKKYYLDYYYGNPNPIMFKYDSKGIIIPSMKLKKELMEGNYVDSKSKVISPEEFEKLPYEQKIQFPGVHEVDSLMFNRILTQKATDDLWGKPESILKNKKMVLIIFILVAVGITVFMVYRKVKMGG